MIFSEFKTLQDITIEYQNILTSFNTASNLSNCYIYLVGTLISQRHDAIVICLRLNQETFAVSSKV